MRGGGGRVILLMAEKKILLQGKKLELRVGAASRIPMSAHEVAKRGGVWSIRRDLQMKEENRGAL